MTEQEIFNKVAVHLIKQNKRSVIYDDNGDDFCRYRSEDGAMCAVGCLISDEEYLPEMEGESVGAIINENVSLDHLRHNHFLLEQLQLIHDQAPDELFLPYICKKLVELAEEEDTLSLPQELKDKCNELKIDYQNGNES